MRLSKVERSACSVRAPTLDDRLDGGKARLAWIAARGDDPIDDLPIDDLRGGVGAGFDAAMALLDGGCGDQLGGRGGAEIVDDVVFEGGLGALERQDVIGLVGDDPVGDLDLTAHGVDGDQGAFELLGLGQLVEKRGNSGDLVALLRHRELRQGQPGGGGVGAQPVQGLEPLAAIVRAARGLPVDGDQVVPVRPQRGDLSSQSSPRTEPDRCGS